MPLCQASRNSSGDCGVKRWMVRTGEPMPAAKSALRSMPAMASSSSLSTRTKAPLGQATGASAVIAMPLAARAFSTAVAAASSLATWRGARQSSMPRQGPSSRRLAICSGSGAALSSGMAAEPVDIELNRLGKRSRVEQ